MSFNLSIFSMGKTDELRDFFYGLPKILVVELGIETETFCCSHQTTLSTICLCFTAQPVCKHSQLVICAVLFMLSETSLFNLLSCKRSKLLHSYTLAVFLCELFTVVFLVFSHPVLAKTILPPVSCHLSFMY